MPVLSNHKHELFAQGLADGKSAEEAHRLSGYKPNRGNAATLKHNQSILARVSELLTEREAIHAQATADAIKSTGLTKAWVIETLVSNVERAMQAEEVRDREGNGLGEYQYQGSVANRALELLGKHLGMFIEKHELTGKDGGAIQTQELKASDALADRISSVIARKGSDGHTGKPN